MTTAYLIVVIFVADRIERNPANYKVITMKNPALLAVRLLGCNTATGLFTQAQLSPALLRTRMRHCGSVV
jgi:hypothetical protein